MTLVSGILLYMLIAFVFLMLGVLEGEEQAITDPCSCKLCKSYREAELSDEFRKWFGSSTWEELEEIKEQIDNSKSGGFHKCKYCGAFNDRDE
jgi:hypothetical protein